MFELLKHVQNVNPEVLTNVLHTTSSAIENLPQKSFIDDNLNSSEYSIIVDTYTIVLLKINGIFKWYALR